MNEWSTDKLKKELKKAELAHGEAVSEVLKINMQIRELKQQRQQQSILRQQAKQKMLKCEIYLEQRDK